MNHYYKWAGEIDWFLALPGRGDAWTAWRSWSSRRKEQQSEGTTNTLAAPHPRPDATVLIKTGARSVRMAYSYRVHWEQNVEPANVFAS